MEKRWRIYPHDAARIRQLEATAGVPAVVAQLLLSRGLSDPSAIRGFLEAKFSDLRDPELLPGVTAAVERIYDAVQSKRRITVYGDYDADGITSSAILYRCLQILGADVGYYVPSRFDEGYGLNSEAVEKLVERGTKLLITVDCGIASVKEAEVAKELGLELIITDHHEMADRLPEAAAIVHPRLPGTNYPFGGLCGAGVAFKLAWALCQKASNAKRVTDRLRNFLLTAVGLASIGTVADVVPLVDENRLIVRHGLNCLREYPVAGIEALLEVAKLGDKQQLTSEDIGFTIGPRLNAAGRLGQAQLAIELLTTDSRERAQALAEYIHQLNDSRGSLERSIYLAASKQAKEEFDPVNDPALVLAGHGWHVGVIGIVAGRLADKFNRPVVLIALDQAGVKPGVGSARSACGLNLHEALKSCEHHLLGCGGHAAAAGLQIMPDKIEAFRAEFVEYAAAEVTDESQVAELTIDAEAPISQLTYKTVNQIEMLAPFGEGNRRPIMCASGAKLVDKPKRIGGGERHLSVHLEHHGVRIRGVAFGQGDWAEPLSKHEGLLDIAFQPVINNFRGRNNVELQLVDWKPHAGDTPPT
ncbi:single-stranded-DNA-specific exonuclease RecJ [Blastopirellula sp. JC732]|uniref:Single-stranded-DNA-specific exonuclease RecJ n=1 Tax=Blastopirellula sediminis TaxID=2894196 RepID=A0A9X1SIU6_9BACT|nr:single-stranded-DNA-specific exonuclease RecJ [Blastopirellula sediminis]MCC9605519.1 single-stranded-DNA-specific exonuclease RecJ [Blastopirellula sediminis]MCC9631181.1 single-stranded-DNA-specific exonuclease RecJ [Blastopirellula sediminis]